MSKRVALWLLGACVVVIAGVMVLAVVLNAREARAFDANGTRVTARITGKHTWDEPDVRVAHRHYCLEVAFARPNGSNASASSCDRGIDRIYEKAQIGDPIRIVYTSDLDFVLEDWATRKVTSFSGP
jgi:hypothetical protein